MYLHILLFFRSHQTFTYVVTAVFIPFIPFRISLGHYKSPTEGGKFIFFNNKKISLYPRPEVKVPHYLLLQVERFVRVDLLILDDVGELGVGRHYRKWEISDLLPPSLDNGGHVEPNQECDDLRVDFIQSVSANERTLMNPDFLGFLFFFWSN